MFNYTGKTSLCLILLFITLGSITTMLFLKNNESVVKQANLMAETSITDQKGEKKFHCEAYEARR